MVATSKPSIAWVRSAASAAAAVSATSGAGTLRVRRGIAISTASVKPASRSSQPDRVARACHIISSRSKKLSGEPTSSSPSTSLSWIVAMTSAMPAVKPVVTGCGMKVIRRPSLARPMPICITPAIMPARSSPLSPKSRTTGRRITTKAAVGPVIWNCVPPSSAHTTPATIAV